MPGHDLARLGKALVQKRHSVRKRPKPLDQKTPLISHKGASFSDLAVIGSPVASGESIIVFSAGFMSKFVNLAISKDTRKA